MIDKLNTLKELRARTEQRRNIWTSSVKNKIIDDMEGINNQFDLQLTPEVRQHPNYERLIFKTKTRLIGIVYDGTIVTQSGGSICFGQLTNGKIEVILIPAKIEQLNIGLEVDFLRLGCFEPQDISTKLINDIVEALITHLIDFDSYEETMLIRANI